MQIKPALNFLTKSTADVIPVNNLLFGEMKKATILEKASKDIVKTPLVISKKVQPIKQTAQSIRAKLGNAPASRARSMTRRVGALSSSRSPRQHSSRSRRR